MSCQNIIQIKILTVADAGYLHWSPNSNEHQNNTNTSSSSVLMKISNLYKPRNLSLTVSPLNGGDLVGRNIFYKVVTVSACPHL